MNIPSTSSTRRAQARDDCQVLLNKFPIGSVINSRRRSCNLMMIIGGDIVELSLDNFVVKLFVYPPMNGTRHVVFMYPEEIESLPYDVII